jgi:hypothetical protein
MLEGVRGTSGIGVRIARSIHCTFIKKLPLNRLLTSATSVKQGKKTETVKCKPVFLLVSRALFAVFGPDDRKNDYNSHQKDQHVDPEIEHVDKRVQRMLSSFLPDLNEST